MISLLEVSIAMSIIAIVYIAVTPLLSEIFTAKGRYYAWLVIILGMIIPFRFSWQGSVIAIDTFMPATNNYFVKPYQITTLSTFS